MMGVLKFRILITFVTIYMPTHVRVFVECLRPCIVCSTNSESNIEWLMPYILQQCRPKLSLFIRHKWTCFRVNIVIFSTQTSECVRLTACVRYNIQWLNVWRCEPLSHNLAFWKRANDKHWITLGTNTHTRKPFKFCQRYAFGMYGKSITSFLLLRHLILFTYYIPVLLFCYFVILSLR